MASSKLAFLSGLLLVLSAVALPGSAAEPAPSAGAGARADTTEVVLGLPKGTGPEVTISLGDGSVLVDLPAGTTYPQDLVAVGAGLFRSANVTKLSASRLRLELRLAGGTFSGVRYDPDTVSIRFRRGASLTLSKEDAAKLYVIGSDDKLQIAVNGSEEMTQQSVVTRTGTVSAPLVGEIQAAGLSVDEFTRSLTDALERDYLVSPKVDVEVVDYRSQYVMVAGEVRRAHRVPLRGATTLKDVLAEAEGLTSEAGERITISRQNPTAGESATMAIDREAFERGEMNPPLRNGDIVTVEPAAYCFVNGEVKTAGPVKVTRGLTLMRAISMAGGLTEWANRKEVQLSQKDSDVPPKVFNLKKIESNPELDPPIKGGELIMVRRRFL